MGGEGRGGSVMGEGEAGETAPPPPPQKLGNSGGQVPEESSEPLRLHSWKLLP